MGGDRCSGEVDGRWSRGLSKYGMTTGAFLLVLSPFVFVSCFLDSSEELEN
jgi:hypothetical protein